MKRYQVQIEFGSVPTRWELAYHPVFHPDRDYSSDDYETAAENVWQARRENPGGTVRLVDTVLNPELAL